MTAFAPPVPEGESAPENTLTDAAVAAKKPRRLSLSNWPVRWKILAIVLVPVLLAAAFGGLRIYNGITAYRDLKLAADRAQLVRPIEGFMSAMDGVLLAAAGAGDVGSALHDFDARRSELQQRLGDPDVAADVRSGISSVLKDGQNLRDQVASNSINGRQQVIEYAPMLLTSEDAITGSVRTGDEAIRAQAQGLSRAVGHRGQLLMMRLLLTLGGQLPDPELLRTSMLTVAGTEPSTVLGLGQLLGEGSPDMATLRDQMVRRLAILGDPASVLPENPDLLGSLQTSNQIVDKVIKDSTASITKAVTDRADAARTAAIRDSAIVVAAILAALLLVFLVARSLVRPLRRLRTGALEVAHEELPREIDEVRAGHEPPTIKPIPVYTSDEIGQVAGAVDELHEQALMMASEQAALQHQVGDMFETLSRRSRTLVDQQLTLIDGLERNEEDPDRLDSLFRLDHLAARMRRNGANLLVLSGATVRREQADPMPLAAVINAAASEVEDYRRVTTSTVPDTALAGSVAADVIHLLAELIDNALRYSPPTSPVRVSGVHTGNGGLVIEVSDTGLGMTEGDLRMANTRLKSGGEITSYTARHMGLFVAGRLAHRHGLVVRLRSSVAGEPDSGTTAGVYVPVELLGGEAGPHEHMDVLSETPSDNGAAYHHEEPVTEEFLTDPQLFGQPEINGSGRHRSASGLPLRDPGASGVADAPSEPVVEAVVEPGPDESQRSPADTSAFFGSRADAEADELPTAEPDEPDVYEPDEEVATLAPPPSAPLAPPPSAPLAPPPSAPPTPSEPQHTSDDDSPIFKGMVSEWLGDFDALTAPPQDWRSVWDHGWAAAAEAEETPVHAHTDHGLPVREPGARLVPGSAESTAPSNGAHAKPDEDEVGSASEFGYGRHELGHNRLPLRDPDAVRASISNHFGGVHAGRSDAREADEGMDTE